MKWVPYLPAYKMTFWAQKTCLQVGGSSCTPGALNDAGPRWPGRRAGRQAGSLEGGREAQPAMPERPEPAAGLPAAPHH